MIKKLKINYDEWPRQKMNVTDLFLDPENIRLQVEVKSSPEALINDLFINENAFQILRSITMNGFFPDELPVVVKENGKLIVIDGNRRVAALKALIRPEIVPSKETAIKAVKDSAHIPKQIEVVIAPDRGSVQQLLASKHTQNTRRPWRPLRQAYFYKAELARGKTVEDLRKEYPGVHIEKFLRMLNMHKIAKSIQYDDDKTARRVHDDRNFPASTMERLYEDRQVRDFLGFDFDKDGGVEVKIQKKEFEKGFKKVVQDVVDKVIDSRALNSEKNRRTYLAGFSKSQTPKHKLVKKLITSKDFKETPPARKRTKLAPKDIVFNLPCPGVRRILEELQEIKYIEFPNATHDLLRSFLECGLKAFFDRMGKNIPTKKSYVALDDALKAFIDEMTSAKNNKIRQVALKIRDHTKMHGYTAEFLNATNHNPDLFATAKEVLEAWETMEPLIRYILNPPIQNVKNNTHTA